MVSKFDLVFSFVKSQVSEVKVGCDIIEPTDNSSHISFLTTLHTFYKTLSIC